MVAFTTAKQLIQPANSSYVGIWDQPVNSNWGVIDAALGQSVAISLNNSPVTLAANQFQCAIITFNSTLTGSVPITFPTSFTGFYTVQNICTGSSAFIVTLQTTAAGGQIVACPPGEFFDIINDGTNIKFRNFGRVGSYWDYGGSSVPAWVAGCTIPPYLNCDGTSFSSISYPALTLALGGTTLPDSRGRGRFSLNQGTGRLTTASGALDGNTNFAGGGSESITLTSTGMPVHTHGVTDPGHVTPMGGAAGFTTGGIGYAVNNNGATMTNSTQAAFTGISINNAGSGGSHPNVPPGYIGGLTLIRAA